MAVNFSKVITREDTAALEEVQNISNEIIQAITTTSTVLPLMKKLPNMTASQAKLAVLAALPEAYWVNGDAGLKGVTNAAWKNKYLYAEEIAVVVPISDNVIADADHDIWGELKPLIVEAFNVKIDEAILLGKDKPAQWRDGLIKSITDAGNGVTATSNIYEDISDAMTKVELDGYDVTGLMGGVALKGEFRKGLRDTTGQPLANSEVTELPRAFAKNGVWDNGVKAIVGDFKQAVYAIRSDIEFKMFDSGVITDSDGKVLYNLIQNDMKALRVTMRLAWELPNPINRINPTEAGRLPFAYIGTPTAAEE